MIVALVVAALGLSASGPLSSWLLLRYLRDRDERDIQERRRLLVHIQAPDTAAALAVADEEPETASELYVGFDNDEEFFAAKREGA